MLYSKVPVPVALITIVPDGTAQVGWVRVEEVKTGEELTASVTAALLVQLVVVLVTFAYTVVLPLTKAVGVPMEVVRATLLNQVTATPLAPPVTVVLRLVKLKEAVVPPGEVEHNVLLAVLATGWSTVTILVHVLTHVCKVVVTETV